MALAQDHPGGMIKPGCIFQPPYVPHRLLLCVREAVVEGLQIAVLLECDRLRLRPAHGLGGYRRAPAPATGATQVRGTATPGARATPPSALPQGDLRPEESENFCDLMNLPSVRVLRSPLQGLQPLGLVLDARLHKLPRRAHQPSVDPARAGPCGLA